ncbi:MAG: EamA family transporter, partial [Candidatus Gastranaerophilaceae bacterium]
SQILSLLYLGLVPTGLGFWFWNKGAEQVKHYVLAIMNNLKIPLGILFAILFFGEKITPVNFILGSIIILTAIFILNNLMKKDCK